MYKFFFFNNVIKIVSVKPGEKYREIGNIIQKHAQANGFSVVKSYCGHGIHKLFHTAPNIPHYASKGIYEFFFFFKLFHNFFFLF